MGRRHGYLGLETNAGGGGLAEPHFGEHGLPRLLGKLGWYKLR